MTISEFKPKENTEGKVFYIGEKEDAVALTYSTEKVQEFQEAIKAYPVEYGYDELFDYENLYESTMNQHLHLDDAKYNQYNAEFVPWYREYRKMLFDSFENLTLEEYRTYVAGDGVNSINANLRWMSEEKKGVLVEKYAAHQCQYKMK